MEVLREACSLEGELVNGRVDDILAKYEQVPQRELSRVIDSRDFEVRFLKERTRVVTLDGIDMRCFDNIRDGKRRDSVFLLIHGLGGSMDQFQPLMKLLSLLKYRVIALDLPGFGQSGSSTNGYDMLYVTSVVKKVVDNNIENKTDVDFKVVGHSMGCYIASHFVQMYHEEYNIDKLVLTCPPPPSISTLRQDNYIMKMAMRGLMWAPFIFNIYRVWFDQSKGLNSSGIMNFFSANTETFQDEETENKNLKFRKLWQFSNNIKIDTSTIFSYFLGWKFPDWEDLDNIINTNNVELVVIYAEHDKITPKQDAQLIFDAFRNVAATKKKLLEITNCGHNIFFNCPEKACKLFQEQVF